MRIRFNEETKIFQINTLNTTYMMGVYMGKHLLHLYYGKKMEDMNCKHLFRSDESPASLHMWKKYGQRFFDTFSFEYPAYGTGDYKDIALRVRDAGGHRVCELHYDSYRIYEGKPSLKGMPATFAGKEAGQGAETLEITLKDELLGLKILLRYSVFEDSDAIIRSVVAVNESNQKIYLEKIASACLDMDNEEYSLSTLHGTWSRERHIKIRPVTDGKISVGSLCGETSHANQPFMMLTSKGATQKRGDVYGMHFIYSGNFHAATEMNYEESVRMTMGIHPDGFEWVLDPGADFETPEAVLVYSGEGIGKMTRTFHNLYRNHLIRSKYLHQKRPILVNNWEATYFNFDDDKLVAGPLRHQYGIE